MNDSAFYFKVPDSFLCVYRPKPDMEVHYDHQGQSWGAGGSNWNWTVQPDEMRSIVEWINQRHQKRQEWCLFVLFEFTKICDYSSKRTWATFDKIK